MEASTINPTTLDKARELCSFILESDEYRDSASKIETFFENSSAQNAYRSFTDLGESLHYKQSAGKLTQEDIDGYEAAHASLRENAVTADFLDAEASLNSIASLVTKMVKKSLELGRVPEIDELSSGGCCGGGCGCGH